MSDTYELTFDWPHPEANNVVVTGSFDNWSASTRLERAPSGFSKSVAVPWDSKVTYKFIVDGNWTTHENQPTEYDSSGNVNNVVFSPVKPAPEPVAELTENDETQTVASAEAEEVAPEVPIQIQPVADATTDTTKEANPVSAEVEASTHVPAPPEAVDVKEDVIPAESASPSTEVTPTPELAKAPEAEPEETTIAAPEPVHADPAPASESSAAEAEVVPKPVDEPLVRPSMPPPQESATPKASTPVTVTPVKTTATSIPAPASPTHARTSTTVSTTPPSSIAPSTPQTQSLTNPTIAEASAENQASPGRKSVKSAVSGVGTIGRKPSLMGKIKSVFKSKGSPEKIKKRFGSESPARSPARA